jgi:hypothetical protein
MHFVTLLDPSFLVCIFINAKVPIPYWLQIMPMHWVNISCYCCFKKAYLHFRLWESLPCTSS